jgi:hypothetical protein
MPAKEAMMSSNEEVPNPKVGGNQSAASEAENALAIAAQILETVGEIKKSLQGLQRSKASKRMVWWLILSVAMDVILSLTTILLAVGQINGNSARQSVQYSQCIENNASRSQDLFLWDTLLTYIDPPGTKTTPANKKTIDEVNNLRRIAAGKDASRDCAKLYK